MISRAWVRAAIAAAAITGTAGADVIYVDPDATGVPTGTSWTNAFRQLGVALASAGDGDEIWIASGRYVPPSGGWTLGVGASLFGGFTPGASSVDDRDPTGTPTILDADTNGDDGPGFANRADNAERVLTVDAPGATVRLDGLAIRGCDGWSAVDVLAAETATLETCLFRENRRTNAAIIVVGGIPLAYGGGARFRGDVTSAAVVSCVFEDNRTFAVDLDPVSGFVPTGGGAAFSSLAGATVVDDSVFRRNTAEHANSAAGGAVVMFTETVSVRGCTFTDNEADAGFGAGGALHIQGPIDGSTVAQSVVLVDSVFEGNRSGGAGFAYGGAARIRAGDQTIARCGFVGNATGFEPGGAANDPLGGALLLDQAESLDMVNCRVLGNDAGNGIGGGICLLVRDDSPNAARITGGLVAGNRAARAGGVFLGRDGVGGIGVTISGSTIAFNSATAPEGDCSDGAGVVVAAEPSSDVRIANTILWGNDTLGVADEDTQISQCFPVVSLARCLVQGWTGTLGGVGNAGDDPLFTDPDGADSILGTGDDAFFLRRFSPAIDAGSNSLIPPDALDLDGDGITAEGIPFDVEGRERRADDIDIADSGSGNAPVVDIGALEFQRRSCPADLDANGILDLSDINAFVMGFPAQDPGADLNGDGVWDLADINIFVAVFTAGCP
jgi:hypothetical protein